MNDLQVFNSADFGEVRTKVIDGEPWFVAVDICRILEIKNNRDVLSRLDDDEKGVVLTDTPGGIQQLTAVNESGLYSLVLGSRKSEAKAFKRWIVHDVIPSIRKTGSYSVVNRESLSPTLQMLYMLADNSAAMEMEQKKQAEQIKALDTTLSTMKEIMTEPLGDWKDDIKKRVIRIAQARNMDYQVVYAELYDQLEADTKVILKKRCEGKKARMEKAGNTKGAIKLATTKLAVIYDDPKLRIIFENIVKKWAMRYCA